MPVKTVLRKVVPSTASSDAVIDTSTQPVDENAADRLAQELGVGLTPTEPPVDTTEAMPVAVLGAKPAVSPYSSASDGGLEGEFDQSDFKLPQLKIVNGSGPLSKEYNQGTLLYADELLWGPPDIKDPKKNPIMRIVPVKAIKQWRENLTQDEVKEGIMPRVVSTREEAESLGGTTRWIGNEKPRWSPSAKIVFLLQEPENCSHPGFSTQLDGANYAPAVYYSSGSSFKDTAGAIFNAALISLKDNGRVMLHKKFWTFQVIKKQAGDFTVFVPALRLLRDETGPELRDFVAQFNNANTSNSTE